MTHLKFFFWIFCLLLTLFSEKIVSAQTSELKSIIPDAEESLNSGDLQRRISILDKLVLYRRSFDTVDVVLPYKLQKDDYAYVIGKIFEKDLSQAEEKNAPIVFSKIEYLIRKFELRQYLKNLVDYIPKFIPNAQSSDSRVAIQLGILSTIKYFNAGEFAPQITSLLWPATARTLTRAALATLVDLRAKEAVPSLQSLLYDHNYQERYYALESLVKLNDRGSAWHIAKLLKDENINNRYWALDALVKFDGNKPYIKEVQEFLAISKSLEARTLAIASLVDSNEGEAIRLATELITDKDGHVRGQMAERIIAANAKPVIPALMRILDGTSVLGGDIGTDSNIRLSVIAALRGLKAREAIPIFRKYVRERNRSLQTVAAQTLGEFDVKEAVDELLEMFYRDLPNPSDRITNSTYDSAAAALALAKIGDKRTWKALIDTSENPHFPYRSQIIQELNKHIDPTLWKKADETKN